MADKSKKVSDNVPGKYYVDENCIGCGLCTSTAPSVFVLNNDEIGRAHV